MSMKKVSVVTHIGSVRMFGYDMGHLHDISVFAGTVRHCVV